MTAHHRTMKQKATRKQRAHNPGDLRVVECPHCVEEFVVGEGTGQYECPHCGGEVELTLECPECGADLDVGDWNKCACPKCSAGFDPWECSELTAGEAREISLAGRGEAMMKISAGEVPIIDVDLDAPAAERWVEPCRKIARMVGELTDEVLELAKESLPQNLQFLLHNRGKRAAGFLSVPVRTRLGSLYQECRGVARATGVPAELIALSNCIYDFTQLVRPDGPTACSCAAFGDRAGQPVILRFMDWFLPENIGNYSVITRFYRDGEMAYASVGFAGFLGVVTAAGPNWAVALNQAPCSWQQISKLALLRGLPACYAMRVACDYSDSFEEMKENILGSVPMTPFLSLLCGSGPGEVARIEKVNTVTATCTKLSKKQPLMALSNHYIHRAHRQLNSVTEWEDEDGQAWMNDTHERMESVFEMAADAGGCAKLPAFGTFRRDPACNDGTVHLALMRPATAELRLKNFRHRERRVR